VRRPGAGLVVPVLLLPISLVSAGMSHAETKPIPLQTRPSSRTCVPPERRGKVAMCPRTSGCLSTPGTVHPGQRLTVPECRARAEAQTRPAHAPGRDSVVRRVGPRRILTELVLVEPDFEGERIAFLRPVEGPIISAFGQRRKGWHAGIDISAERGSPVLAAASGTVIYSGWIRSYGRSVKIAHMNGFITLYAHNLKNMVEEGDTIVAGQVIATVGSSGHATGPHVHFEVRRDGKAYNPLHLLEPSDQSPVLGHDVVLSSSIVDSYE
jgi:hypothetical protein